MIEWMVKRKRHEFLQHIPPDTSEYQYPQFSALEEIITQERTYFINSHDGQKGPFIIFNRLSLSEFEEH